MCNLNALRWGALSCAFCLLTTRNQRAVQKGQAISDSCAYLRTAQHSTHQGTECSSGVGVKHHRQLPKWLLKATECYGATSAFGNRAWLSFLHCSHCSSSSNTALPRTAPTVPCPGLVPKLWHWTQSVWKQRNKSLGCPVTSVPVTAAELPNCSSQPKEPHSLLPKPTRRAAAVWWKGRSASSSLKSTKWKGSLCF